MRVIVAMLMAMNLGRSLTLTVGVTRFQIADEKRQQNSKQESERQSHAVMRVKLNFG